MACVDGDTFGLSDHGHDAGVALKQLLRVPAIANGALGDVIAQIQWSILPMSKFTWIPYTGNNAGNALGVFQKDNSSPDMIGLKEVRVTVMEDNRSQVVHELVHGLDMHYFAFNLSHPPLAAKLAARVPVLYLTPNGSIVRYDVMGGIFADPAFIRRHVATLKYCASQVRNNSQLDAGQRKKLVTQLEYAARSEKEHVEFTANIAQCLALIYQWGFTGSEPSGALGRPRTLTLVIRQMEAALRAALGEWRRYVPPARKRGAIVDMTKSDADDLDLFGGKHFKSDNWWVTMDPRPPGF